MNIMKLFENKKVKWDNQIGISLETHEEYIKNFGKTFYDQVIKLIDRNQIIDAKKNVLNEADSELIREVLDHARFCKEKVSQFHGRKQLLDQVLFYNYLLKVKMIIIKKYFIISSWNTFLATIMLLF